MNQAAKQLTDRQNSKKSVVSQNLKRATSQPRIVDEQGNTEEDLRESVRRSKRGT
jgi:hypothetical protein